MLSIVGHATMWRAQRGLYVSGFSQRYIPEFPSRRLMPRLQVPAVLSQPIGRTIPLVLIGFLMVIGGLFSGVPGSTIAPAPLAHALGAPPSASPSPAAWVPMSMSGYGASPNPVFLGATTTISVTVSGGLPYVNSTTGAKTYAYSYSGLPAGCTGGNVSSFSCAPTAVGNFTIVLTVHDAGVNVSQNAITLAVHGIEITAFTASPTTVSLGASVTLSATVQGAAGAIAWTWAGLPAGCAAVNSSSLTCTPTTAGTSSVTVTATDTSGRANSRVASFTVTPVRVTLFRDSPTDIYTGQSTTFFTSTTGTIGTIHYAYTGLPTGSSTCLSQDASSWTCIPRVPGTFTVTVTAKDTAGDTSSMSTTLIVKPLTILSYSVSPTPSYDSLQTTFSVSAAGYLGAVVGGVATTGYPIYSYSGLPLGCNSANVSRLVCRPDAAGTYTVEVFVSDPTGNVTTANVTLHIYGDQLLDLYTVVNTQVNPLPQANQTCLVVNNSPFWQATCSPQELEPTLLPFANGTVGLAYEQYTTQTTNTCFAGASADTVARVMFALSSDNGTTFGSSVNLGPTGCPYLNAIEPSFALNKAGTVYGVFVMENSSTAPGLWGNRTADALGFVSSSNGGASFSAVSTITGAGSADLARPAIAVIGDTIYLVYENIANGSKGLPGAPYNALPISVEFTSSTNGGGSWSTPVRLPGLNAASSFNAMSPSIAVSSTGEIAVAYATDRSCVAWAGAPSSTPCLNYGSEVVVSTSTNNGSAWSSPSVASRGIPSNPLTSPATNGSFLGETTCDTGTCLPFFFQSTPETAVRFNANGSDLFVAWAGTLNNTVTVSSNLWWRWTAVGVSATSNSGGSWTGGIVASTNAVATTTSTGNRSNYYRPAIGVEGSELYLTYTLDNETNTTSGIGAQYPGPFDNGFSQWGDEARFSSPGGVLTLSWNASAPITVESIQSGRSTNFTANSFTGYGSSLAFTAAGVALTSYALAQPPVNSIVSRAGYYAANTSYATDLEVAGIGQPGWSQVVNLIIDENGLPAGYSWTIYIDGQAVTSNATSLLLPNIPYGVEIFQKLGITTFAVPWGEQVTQPTIPATRSYYSESTIAIVYSFLAYYNETVYGPVSPTTVTSNCNPTSQYCEWDSYRDDYIEECLPITGYTCSTAPATSSISSECSPFGQAGCYELSYYSDNYTYVGPNYFYSERYTYEDLYTYAPGIGFQEAYYLYNYCYNYGSGSSSGGCSYAYAAHAYNVLCPTNAPITWFGENCTSTTTVGIWLPFGFKITAGEEGLYQNWIANLPDYPTYFNGTGSDAYNGGASVCNTFSACPLTYYQYTYYAAYIPYECYYYYYYYGEQHNWPCWGSTNPVTIEGPVNETDWNIPTTTPPPTGGTTVEYPLDVIPQGLPNGTRFSFSLGATNYSAVMPSSVLIANATPGIDSLANGTANDSARAGWVYYAPAVTVDVPDVAIVDLNFTSLVDASAPVRTLTVHATNLTTGTQWSLQFNGTLYHVTTSDANVSARPGYYAVSSVETGSPDGQTEYFPQNPSASVNFSASATYDLSFRPSYKVWIIASGGGTVQIGTGKPGPGASAFYAAGTQLTLLATPAAGYEFLGFTGTGSGSYTGPGTLTGGSYSATVNASGPIQEGAAFALLPAARYNATFVSNLPDGISWTLYLGGVGYTSNHTTLTVGGLYPASAAQGHYTLSVGDAYSAVSNGTRYVAGGYEPQVTVNSTGPTVIPITFVTQYQVSYSSSAGGTLLVTAGSVPETGNFWAPAGQLVNAQATSLKGYRFLGWNGTGNGSMTSANKTITFYANGPVSEVASFIKIPYQVPRTYIIGYTTSGLAPGTAWTVTLTNKTGTWHFSSLTSTLDVILPNNSYSLSWSEAFSSNGLTRYVPTNAPSTLYILGKNATYPVTFDTQYYVSIEASSWGSVSASVGTPPAAAQLSGWFGQNTKLTFSATPTTSALFEGWTGSGSGAAYSGGSLNQTIVLTGPVTELAQFEPPAPPVVQKGGIFSSTVSWIAFAIVGLAAGLAVGLLLWRRRREAEPAPATWEGTDASSTPMMEAPAGGETMEEVGPEPPAPEADPGADQ
jgi:hypothetical protein